MQTLQDKLFDLEMDYFDTYGKGCGFKTRWSLFDKGIKFGELSEFAPGTVITNRCGVWGYDTEAVVGGRGTWGDVWLACDSAIRNARDDEGNPDHHVFIEGFERNKDGTWNVVTGS
jgi:hypothetical protein